MLVILNKAQSQVAVNPQDVSSIAPVVKVGVSDWTLITMKGGKEIRVNHDFAFVIGKLNAPKG